MSSGQPPDQPPRPSFGRGQAAAADDGPALDFAALRGGGEPAARATPRWMAALPAVMLLALIAGGIYFVYVTLSFKAAIVADTTAVYGPYPSFAVMFVIIPAYCGLCFLLLDLCRLHGGIAPFASLRGIAASAAAAIILLLICLAPLPLLRHSDNGFARLHGYVRCSSPFDPQHVRIYALKDYADVYGCPTVSLPQ